MNKIMLRRFKEAFGLDEIEYNGPEKDLTSIEDIEEWISEYAEEYELERLDLCPYTGQRVGNLELWYSELVS